MTDVLHMDGIGRRFKSKGRSLHAVRDMTVGIPEGQITCLVGESGCGKTTAGRILAGLLEPTIGVLTYRSRPVAEMARRERGQFQLAVQYVHQDPYASLIPSRTVRQTLAAPLRRHGGNDDVDGRILELLDAVGLSPADDIARAYPNELSGGQRQRVSIARALTVQPDVLVADEAVSMIDVSLRLSVLDTLMTLQRGRGLTIVLITHDLGAARYVASGGNVGVMYMGRLVEHGSSTDVFTNPLHPYTRALLAASRLDDPTERYLAASLATEAPSPLELPAGCPYHPRCADVVEGTCDVLPQLTELTTRRVACHVAVANQTGHSPSIPTDR